MAYVTNENGMKEARLICVAAGEMEGATNNNKFYHMRQVSASEFEAEWGRVGKTSTKKLYPMADWDKKYHDKTRPKSNKKKYDDMTELLVEKTVTGVTGGSSKSTYEEFKAGRPEAVKEFVRLLQRLANKSVQENYTVKVQNVTQKQVDQAQSILNGVASHATNPTDLVQINKTLIELYKTIPRNMGKVSDHLLDVQIKDLDAVKKRLNHILEEEQRTLDVMAGQVQLQNNIAATTDEDPVDEVVTDMLDAAGMELEPCTDADISIIKQMMLSDARMFLRAFRVVNKKTQTLYDSNMNRAADKKEMLFWHGSRSENWWSIATTGLLIRPSSAVYSGSMFGDGIYGADKFTKSLNYTSHSRAMYTGGRQARAYLGIFAFHVGKQLVWGKHTSECYGFNKQKLQAKGGFDSVFAKGGYDLVNNEYIVYHPSQTTIKYLIEVG